MSCGRKARFQYFFNSSFRLSLSSLSAAHRNRILTICSAMEYIIRGRVTILFNIFLVISSCLEFEFLPTRFNFEFKKSSFVIYPEIALGLWFCRFLVPISHSGNATTISS
jgi:hypothetical protein